VDDGVLPRAQVLDLDLSRDQVPDLEVDAIVSMMTLHHIPDLSRCCQVSRRCCRLEAHR
jgi:hypothetical protein